jgi:hypothetical protein
MSGYDTAKAVLAKASLGDSTIPQSDPGVLHWWAEKLEGIDVQAALRAVDAHYSEEHRKVMPADIIKRVKAEQAYNRYPDIATFNAIPDADPDDVPAYLDALRAGRLIDESPKTLRDMPQLLATFQAEQAKNRSAGGAA